MRLRLEESPRLGTQRVLSAHRYMKTLVSTKVMFRTDRRNRALDYETVLLPITLNVLFFPATVHSET